MNKQIQKYLWLVKEKMGSEGSEKELVVTQISVGGFDNDVKPIFDITKEYFKLLTIFGW